MHVTVLFSLIVAISSKKRHSAKHRQTRQTWTVHNIKSFPPCQAMCKRVHEQCKIKQYLPRLLFKCIKPPECSATYTPPVGENAKATPPPPTSPVTWSMRDYNRRPSCKETCLKKGLYCVTIRRRPTLFGCDNAQRTIHRTTHGPIKGQQKQDQQQQPPSIDETDY